MILPHEEKWWQAEEPEKPASFYKTLKNI